MKFLLDANVYTVAPYWKVWLFVGLSFVACRLGESIWQLLFVYGDAGKDKIHDVSGFREAPYYFLLYASGLPIVMCIGIQQVAAVVFQVPLNTVLGGAWYNEDPTWKFLGKDRRKLFHGWRRAPQLVLGFVIIAFDIYFIL